MTSKKQEFQSELEQEFTNIFRQFGLDMLSSTLISMLFVTNREISMDDLAEKTGYSLSGVSGKLKFIENLGMIQRKKKPGSKKIYYLMDKDLKIHMIKKINRGLELEVKPVKEKVPKILEKYQKEVQQSKDEDFKEQYSNVKKYVEDIAKIEKILQNTIKEIERM